MTPPEIVAGLVLAGACCWLAAAALARATRYVEVRVGRTALELADRTGWWEGTRLTPHPHTRIVEPLRVRVERDDDGTWTVEQHHGQTTATALRLDDSQAEALVGRWWGQRGER